MTSPAGDEKTHYEVLGVASDATTEEIRRVGRRLIVQHHPDRGGDAELAAAINAALDKLSNPKTREEYDEFLLNGGDDAEAEAPDPDTYEDNWGDDTGWEDEGDVPLDVEVEDTPDPTPEPPPPGPAPDTAPQSDFPTPTVEDPAPQKPTKVHTALQRGTLLGLLPTVIMNLAAFAQSYTLFDGEDSWAILPGAGMTVGFLVPFLFRNRLPRTDKLRTFITLMVLTVAFFVCLAVFTMTSEVIFAPFFQSLVVTLFGTWIFTSAAHYHRQAEQVIAHKHLREDGTIFGASTGDTAGELLKEDIWRCLSMPGMHAGRGFQTSDIENHFTKAVLLGNRLALLRPMYIPGHLLPPQSPTLYWSPPSLFMRSGYSGVPDPVLRLDLHHYRTALKKSAQDLTVQEFLVVYTPPGAPRLTFPAENPQMPHLLDGDKAADGIREFLTGAKRPVHHVDHSAVASSIISLEYRAVHGLDT